MRRARSPERSVWRCWQGREAETPACITRGRLKQLAFARSTRRQHRDPKIIVQSTLLDLSPHAVRQLQLAALAEKKPPRQS